jgi:hypothetical protein
VDGEGGVEQHSTPLCNNSISLAHGRRSPRNRHPPLPYNHEHPSAPQWWTLRHQHGTLRCVSPIKQLSHSPPHQSCRVSRVDKPRLPCASGDNLHARGALPDAHVGALEVVLQHQTSVRGREGFRQRRGSDHRVCHAAATVRRRQFPTNQEATIRSFSLASPAADMTTPSPYHAWTRAEPSQTRSCVCQSSIDTLEHHASVFAVALLPRLSSSSW